MKRDLAIAFGTVGATIAVEYSFRHYVLFWLPTFGSLFVNDMLSLLLGYALLLTLAGRLAHTDWRLEARTILRAADEGVRSWSFSLAFVLLVLSMSLLPPLDRLLWGRFSLPMLLSPYRSPLVWLAAWTAPLKAVSYPAVNGLFVPVAEEYLWRGIVQARLLRRLPAWLAIGLTSILFSLKHVLVDASWGRFLAIVAFGIVCGLAARRRGWQSSAVLHVAINTLASLLGLLLGLV